MEPCTSFSLPLDGSCGVSPPNVTSTSFALDQQDSGRGTLFVWENQNCTIPNPGGDSIPLLLDGVCRGPPGYDGLDGDDGVMGPPGPQGAAGAAGATGASGPTISIPGQDGDDSDLSWFSPSAQIRMDAIPIPFSSVDFNGQQLVSARIENRTSDPASPTVGQMWLRTDL